MSDKEPINDHVYAGPSKTIEVLGRGNAYGWIGSALGFIAGGVSSLVGTHTPGKWTQKATDLFKEVGIKLDGKWPIVIGGALVGLQIGHFLGFAVGVRAGAKKAGAGQEQFDRLSSENVALREQVRTLKSNCTSTHLDLGEGGKIKPLDPLGRQPKQIIETGDSKAEGVASPPAQASGIAQG